MHVRKRQPRYIGEEGGVGNNDRTQWSIGTPAALQRQHQVLLPVKNVATRSSFSIKETMGFDFLHLENANVYCVKPNKFLVRIVLVKE